MGCLTSQSVIGFIVAVCIVLFFAFLLSKI